jgi:transposase-like protein
MEISEVIIADTKTEALLPIIRVKVKTDNFCLHGSFRSYNALEAWNREGCAGGLISSKIHLIGFKIIKVEFCSCHELIFTRT